MSHYFQNRRGKNRGTLCAALLVASVVLATGSQAGAQSEVAAAEELFREARALMKAGNYEKACPKLEESQRLDPAVGTLANLALCYEKTKRLASAWAKYLEAADESKRRGEKRRARAAAKKAKALLPKLHRVVIIVPKSSRIDGLTITRDGAEVGEGSYGSKVPVDQGDVEITASAPGFKSWSRTITLKRKKLRVVEIPKLEEAPELVPDPEGPKGNGSVMGPQVGTRLVPAGPWYKDTLGWALLGAGVAVAVGGGVGALPHASSQEKKGNEPGIGLEAAESFRSSAETFRVLGFGMLISGGALAILGGVKLAINPDRIEPIEADESTTSLLIGPRSIGVSVSF